MTVARLIDTHVHILPESVLGARYERLHTEQLAYGLRKTYDGSFYAAPPYIPDSQFTADTLIYMMDVYGVERAVIQQTPILPLNEDVADAVEKYPDRLSGAMLLEPEDGWREQMEYWHARGPALRQARDALLHQRGDVPRHHLRQPYPARHTGKGRRNGHDRDHRPPRRQIFHLHA